MCHRILSCSEFFLQLIEAPNWSTRAELVNNCSDEELAAGIEILLNFCLYELRSKKIRKECEEKLDYFRKNCDLQTLRSHLRCNLHLLLPLIKPAMQYAYETELNCFMCA